MKELTWHKAIEKVLKNSSEPLSPREITEQIIADDLREGRLGSTPSCTVAAQIGKSIKDKKDNSPYIRISKGIFTLRNMVSTDNKPKNTTTEQDLNLEDNDIVSSFGMFWRRKEVEWTSKPKLLGMQGIGADPIDFSQQIGVYLLYSGKEIIYVGKSVDRPIGKRLYEHTRDRLSSRWNTFSWFGLLPLSDKGEIKSLPKQYNSEKIIPFLEAILIEALEPRQNRKRGDDLSDFEYIQKTDLEIEKKRMQAFVINKM